MFQYMFCDNITGQEASPQENGEVSPEAEFVPRKCDTITISGRAEKCELAKAALLVGSVLFLFILYLEHLTLNTNCRFLGVFFCLPSPLSLFISSLLVLSLPPSPGVGAHNGGRGGVLRAASLHHWSEGQWNQEDDGGVRG